MGTPDFASGSTSSDEGGSVLIRLDEDLNRPGELEIDIDGDVATLRFRITSERLTPAEGGELDFGTFRLVDVRVEGAMTAAVLLNRDQARDAIAALQKILS